MGVGATIYFGSEESKRQMQEVTAMFQHAHELGHVHRALVLPPQPGVQDEGRRLPCRRRPHRAGEPPRRDDRGRHHQAEAARDQRRLHGAELRQDEQEGLHRAHDRPSDRPDALPGGELLHGPRGPDQLGRRVVGRERPQGSGEDRRHQQARRRDGADLGTQGVPASDEGRRRPAERDSGRVSEQGRSPSRSAAGRTAQPAAGRAFEAAPRYTRTGWRRPSR